MKKFSLSVLIVVFFSISVFSQNLKQTISSIGCKQISRTESIPTVQSIEEHKKWLKDTFGVVSKTSFLAKCSVRGTFYRFLFEEETFENKQKALNRLQNLQILPPNEHDKSDYAVPKILAEGFVRGKKLYTIGTFALFIETDGFVKKYRNKLARQIK